MYVHVYIHIVLLINSAGIEGMDHGSIPREVYARPVPLLERLFPKFPMADLNQSCMTLSTLNLGKYGAIVD